MRVYADLHVHVGFSNGRYIKIPSSKELTIENILKISKNEKGLNVIGIVDFLCDDVLSEVETLIDCGRISLKDNNLYFEDILIIPAAEIELRYNQEDFHCLIFFESIDKLISFKKQNKRYFNQLNFSCPVFKGNIEDFEKIAKDFNLFVVPAHAFTPYKGFYSAAFAIEEVFKKLEIYTIELGLSADSYMVKDAFDIQGRTLLSNSDAHSLRNIAREFNEIEVLKLTADMVLKSIKENKVIANYGINPRLGKYHKSYCKSCNLSFNIEKRQPICPFCGRTNIVVGVEDRISMLKKIKGNNKKPPYFYTFPFELVEGFGEKTREKIIEIFKTEINFVKALNNDQSYKDLKFLVSNNIWEKLNRYIKGQYSVKFGAGGYFGKIRFE
ncbi:endonuclease Q family protein [Caldicellulosiruptor naganoensis]|uniref:Endonuclease Q family protein n=1 Tax=Caldicellulosiruptor naganoensis TaxID=29324 RepID=A0ABY7BDV4_9FIRM|nr:endonuclease Q family protein [Caldicellulosiruptor naganoensis]WAM30620.1 endonuclease Q family protein [Caldicellulosiruptor naganoensis]